MAARPEVPAEPRRSAVIQFVQNLDREVMLFVGSLKARHFAA